MSLEKFDLVNLTTGKTIPISEKPLDFPQLKNMEVHNFEAEVKYPTTTEVLQTYLVDSCTVGRSYLIVRGEFDPIEAQQETKRQIRLLDPQYVESFIEEYETLMKESII